MLHTALPRRRASETASLRDDVHRSNAFPVVRHETLANVLARLAYCAIVCYQNDIRKTVDWS